MERLSYATLKNVGYDGFILESAPEKVLQFGEGNFLRAFVNYWFDLANEKAGWNGKCCLVQPIAPGLAKMINEQDGLYTLYLRGSQNGQKVDDMRVISSVSRCLNPYEEEGFNEMMKVAVSDDLEYVVSNTTEAGIVYDPSCELNDKPCASFPGKLTQVLYARYQAGKKGLIILACELIDNNGKELSSVSISTSTSGVWKKASRSMSTRSAPSAVAWLTASFPAVSVMLQRLLHWSRSMAMLTLCWT